MEQITASVAKFVYEAANAAVEETVTPYYNELKENFKVPAVYFPDLEVGSTPEDLDSYALTFTWYVKFFHATTEQAYTLAKNVLNRLVGGRYNVPIVDTSGAETGRVIRIKRAEILKADSGVYQMWLDWDESYEYDDLEQKPQKMQTYDVDITVGQKE